MSHSKTKQTGVVLEYNGKKDKTPLGGVSLQIEGASSTFSDIRGQFSLNFPQLKPGDYIKDFKIDKPGFELFNTDVIDRLAITPKMPWDIVMMNSAEFKKHRDTLRAKATDDYKRKFNAAMKELEKLRTEKKIMEDEYLQRLTDLSVNYSNQLKNLNNYIEYIARIDLNQISEDEQKVVDMVNAGQLEEAITMYDELDYVRKYKENMADILQMHKVNDALKVKEKASGEYLKGVENHINTLMLAGGVENTRKARDLYESVAQTESSVVNVDWLLKTGNFVFTYFYDLEKALSYYDKALSAAEKQFGWDAFEVARACINIGNVKIAQGEFNNANWSFGRAERIVEKFYSAEHPMMATIYNNLAIVEYNKGNYSNAESQYKKALRILELTDSLDLKKKVPVMINRASCYEKMGNFQMFFDLCIDVLDIVEEGSNDLDEMVIAGVCNNVGNAYFNLKRDELALKYHHFALDKYESVVGVYHPDVADVCYNIGKVHFSRGEYDDALEYFNKSLKIESNLISMRDARRIGDLYKRIGKSFEMLDDEDSAVDNYKRGLRVLEINGNSVDGDCADLYRFVAQYHCNHDDWIVGVDMLCKELDIRKLLLEIQAVEDDEKRRKANLINKNIQIYAWLREKPKKRPLKNHEQEPLAPLYERIGDIYYTHIDGEEGRHKASDYYKKALVIYESVKPLKKYEDSRKRISIILDKIEAEIQN